MSKRRDRITRFTGEHAFLSNFHRSAVELDGILYATVEHAFHAAKTDDPIERERVWVAPTPGVAKRIGRRVTLRAGWDEERQAVMLRLLRQKFAAPDLREQLLATGDAELVEDNYWGDRYWGVSDGVGDNHLGRLLMVVRDEVAVAS